MIISKYIKYCRGVKTLVFGTAKILFSNFGIPTLYIKKLTPKKAVAHLPPPSQI